MASHVSGPALTALGGKGPQSWFGSVTDLLLELNQGFSPLRAQGPILAQDLGFSGEQE